MGNILKLPEEIPENGYSIYAQKDWEDIKRLVAKFWKLHRLRDHFGYAIKYGFFKRLMEFPADKGPKEVRKMFTIFARHSDHINAMELFLALIIICKSKLAVKVQALLNMVNMDGIFKLIDVNDIFCAAVRGCYHFTEGPNLSRDSHTLKEVRDLACEFFQLAEKNREGLLCKSQFAVSILEHPKILYFLCKYGTSDAAAIRATLPKVRQKYEFKRMKKLSSLSIRPMRERPKSAPWSRTTNNRNSKLSQTLTRPRTALTRPRTGFSKTTSTADLQRKLGKVDKENDNEAKKTKKIPLYLRQHAHPTFKPSASKLKRNERVREKTKAMNLHISKTGLKLVRPGMFGVKRNMERARVLKNIFEDIDNTDKGTINLEDVAKRGLRLRKRLFDNPKDLAEAFLNKSLDHFSERPMLELSFRDAIKFLWPNARPHEIKYVEFLTGAPPVTQKTVATMQLIFERLDEDFLGEVPLCDLLQEFKADPYLASFVKMIKVPDENSAARDLMVDLDRALVLVFSSTHKSQLPQILKWILKITPEQEQECEKLFSMYDTDNTGFLAMGRFRGYLIDNGFSDKGASEVIAKIGTKDPKFMTLQEFIKYKRQSWANDREQQDIFGSSY